MSGYSYFAGACHLQITVMRPPAFTMGKGLSEKRTASHVAAATKSPTLQTVLDSLVTVALSSVGETDSNPTILPLSSHPG